MGESRCEVKLSNGENGDEKVRKNLGGDVVKFKLWNQRKKGTIGKVRH